MRLLVVWYFTRTFGIAYIGLKGNDHVSSPDMNFVKKMFEGDNFTIENAV